MANRHTKKYSRSPATREMQIKPPTRSISPCLQQLSFVQMSENDKHWGRRGEKYLNTLPVGLLLSKTAVEYGYSPRNFKMGLLK